MFPMDTQLTPVHTHLWHREFWMLTFAGMLLTVSAFMQLPVLSAMLPAALRTQWMGWGYVAFGGGLLSLGCLISFLVEKYRRNAVCIWAVMAYMAAFAACSFLEALPQEMRLSVFLLLRFVEGAAYGLAQMVLVSTLVTDCCESAQRTDANYAMAWFQRMAVPIGPALGVVVMEFYGADYPLMAVLASALLAIVLILFVRFPFRAPEDTSFHLSLDRFFMLRGSRLALHVMAVGFALGVLVVACFSLTFFAFLIVGFLLALGGETVLGRYRLSGLMPVTGMALLAAAFLLQWAGSLPFSTYAVPLLAGCGVGLSMARLQIYFIRISAHCQRGTSQSSFWIVWELGAALGMAVAFAFATEGGLTPAAMRTCAVIALIVTLVSLLAFIFTTAKWYRSHIQR